MDRSLGRILGAAALAAALVSPATAASGDWQWSVTPYFWLSEVGADVEIGDREVFDRTAEIRDVLDMLDFALQLNVQGQRGRHGVLLDVSYYDFGDDPVRRPLPGPAGSELVAQGDLQETLIDVGGIYNPRGDGMGFALIYGARILTVDQEIDVRIETPAGPSEGRTYATSGTGLDGLLGLRYLGAISERWLVQVKADASTGESELTWSALAGFGYSFGKEGRYTVLGGYRYMVLELEETDEAAEIESEMTLAGPYLGLRFGF